MLKVQDYRDFLNSVVLAKKENSRTSLRAIARQTGLAPSSLHSLIGKKNHITFERLKEVSTNLKLSRYEKKHLLLLHSWSMTENEGRKKELEQKISSNAVASVAKYIQPSSWKSLLKWETLVMHEYLYLNRPKLSELKKVAAILEMSEDMCKQVIETLIHHELVTIGGKGEISRVHQRLLADCVKDHTASQDFHTQVLQKTATAIQKYAAPERYSVGEFICISPDQLPKIQQLTNQYFDSMQALAKKSADSHGKKNIYMVMNHAYPASLTMEINPENDDE